jgi:hypothetical protein
VYLRKRLRAPGVGRNKGVDVVPGWVWALIGAAVAAALAVIVWQLIERRRTSKLRSRFGPEYDRTVDETDSRRDAEAELEAREERHQQLQIRPLSVEARNRYAESWRRVQAEFVDDPAAAVASADNLIQSAMAERGYPVEDFEQRAADISVDHPQVVEHYREGHRLAKAGDNGKNSTESLRQAMRHYRALFDDLVEPGRDQPAARERNGSDAAPVENETGERVVR